MEFLQANEQLLAQYAADITELVHATGPVSYDYHFPKRKIFDALVTHSWGTPNTLFSAEATRLAINDGELLGIEIGFHGVEYRERIAALNPAWAEIVAAGIATAADVQEVIENSDHASWLNPAISEGTYYVHALSVKPRARGKRVGMQLLSNAMESARQQGFGKLQLDVLSDNPAVNFYQSMGLTLLVESRAPIPEQHGVPPEWRMGIVLD
ncbi:MAG: GNAT family N-acetyltransferase [Pseudomonadales bacterium]